MIRKNKQVNGSLESSKQKFERKKRMKEKLNVNARMLIAHTFLVENGKSHRNYSVNNGIGHCWFAHFCPLSPRLTDKNHDKWILNCMFLFVLRTIKHFARKNPRNCNDECMSVLSTRCTCLGMNDKRKGNNERRAHRKYKILCDNMLSFVTIYSQLCTDGMRSNCFWVVHSSILVCNALSIF